MIAALVTLGCAAFFAWLFWPRKPRGVVGQPVPFHDPKRRTRFNSRRT